MASTDQFVGAFDRGAVLFTHPPGRIFSASHPDRSEFLNTGYDLRSDFLERSKQLIVISFGIETPGRDVQPVRIAQS